MICSSSATFPLLELPPQVLKITNLPFTYAQISQAPITITLNLDATPGVRKCTTYDTLFNYTASSYPYSMALFSSDNKCCALPTLPPSPPPPPPRPPPPPPPRPPPPHPPPPPACTMSIAYMVVNNGVTGPTVPPLPTTTTCNILASYMTSLGDGHVYTCCGSTATSVTACASGGLELVSLCNTYGNLISAQVSPCWLV